jgi:toxin ParE1/3/4
MTPTVVFRPAAEHELLEAERWFADRQVDLAQRFRDAVDATLSRIREFPLAFPAVHHDKRRAIVAGFPYALYFRLINDQVVVAAVVHAHRDPAVWRSRR